jgi:hypothetical protein
MSYINYSVESLFWRREIGNILENIVNRIKFSDALASTYRDFSDEKPINARKAAFSHFSSIVDVLYEGLGKKYSSDFQARVDLQKYFDSNNAVELFGNNPEIRQKLTDDIYNGIQIYMVIDKPLPKSKDKIGQKVPVYGFRYIDYPERLDDYIIVELEGLFKEYKYYEKNNYSTSDLFEFRDFSRIGGTAEFLLKTPFDWQKLMDDFDGQKLI